MAQMGPVDLLSRNLPPASRLGFRNRPPVVRVAHMHAITSLAAGSRHAVRVSEAVAHIPDRSRLPYRACAVAGRLTGGSSRNHGNRPCVDEMHAADRRAPGWRPSPPPSSRAPTDLSPHGAWVACPSVVCFFARQSQSAGCWANEWVGCPLGAARTWKDQLRMSKHFLLLASMFMALQANPVHPQPQMLCDQPLDSSPAAMYERIRQLPGAAVAQSRSPNFDVINLPGQVWNFTKDSHPAHPSVACRRIVKDGDALRVETQLRCNAAKTACDQLAEDYRTLDKQMMEAIKQQRKQ